MVWAVIILARLNEKKSHHLIFNELIVIVRAFLPFFVHARVVLYNHMLSIEFAEWRNARSLSDLHKVYNLYELKKVDAKGNPRNIKEPAGSSSS